MGMAKIFKALIAVAVLGALGTDLAGRAYAVDKITAMVSVTNAAGTTNGQTITVNGNVRTWTNAVFASSTQILTNSTAAGAKTNMYNQFALNQFSSVVQVDAGSTNFQLIGNAGTALTVTLSAGWGSVSYSTQTVSTPTPVRVPTSVEAAAVQTNVNSALLAALRDPSDTNQFYESDLQMANFVGKTNDQTIAGAKQFMNAAGLWKGTVSNSPAISGTVAGAGGWGLTNGVYWTPTNVNPVFSNAVNYGNALSSPGSALHSEQFGATAQATAQGGTAVGYQAIASGQFSHALGGGTTASGLASTAVGDVALAQNASDTAVGAFSTAKGTNSTALGALTTVANTHTNSTAIGYGAATTAANQIMLGGSGINAVIQNALSVGGGATFTAGVTNLLHTGTNSFPAGAAISFGRFAITSLANGNNSGVIVGTNVVCDLSGPTGAFTINGMVPVYAGQLIFLVNRTGFNMTLANQSGVDATAANRIICLTGADKTVTGNSSATLWYDGNASRWILLYFGQ